jgi:putative DNA primase/helicase
MKTLLAVTSLISILPLCAAPAPDFAAAREEVVRYLSEYLRIDTVNPPGNETRGAKYLQSILKREGIPSEIFELEPGCGNLVARLAGSGAKKPNPARDVRHSLNVKGTVDQWRRNIARYCSGNSRLLFAISCAAAAPLLAVLKIQGGVFHLFYKTSSGKTTTLRTAGSFWGGGGDLGFVESWKTTANALETSASGHNDQLLLLDELKLCAPEQAADVAYSIANGQAKGRADKHMNAQRRPQWRVLSLSSGELELRAHLGKPQERAYGGQEVRFCSIPARVGPHGLCKDLHHFESAAAFADYLKDKSKQFYGAPAREFITAIIKEGAPSVERRMKRFMEDWRKAFVLKETGADISRAADRFAHVAAAGELLTSYGISGWRPEEAAGAVGSCYLAWFQLHGSGGSLDDRAAVLHFIHYIEKYGDARFQHYKEGKSVAVPSAPQAVLQTKLGYRHEVKTSADPDSELGLDFGAEDREYVLLQDGMTEIATEGRFSLEELVSALADAGLLRMEGEKRQVKRKIPGYGTKKSRCYAVRSSAISNWSNAHSDSSQPDSRSAASLT